MSIKAVIEEFTERLHHLIESDSMERARAAVLHAFGAGPPKRRGRPPKALAAMATTSVAKKPRKKMPRQLCPVPGCKNPAAPIFGMVCAKHKDVPKALIKKYREARRAKKEGAKEGVKVVAKKAPAKRAKRVVKKPAKLARPVPKKSTKPRAAPATTRPITKEPPTAPAAPAAS